MKSGVAGKRKPPQSRGGRSVREFVDQVLVEAYPLYGGGFFQSFMEASGYAEDKFSTIFLQFPL